MESSSPIPSAELTTPRVSVLVACFRHAPFLEACLESIHRQQGVSFEIIARDDGSDDGTAELLERLAPLYRVVVVRGGGNLGVAGSQNRMLALARGEFVVDFASDDIMPPGRLKAQVEWLDAHPTAPACTGQCVRMDAEGRLEDRPDGRFLSAIPEASFEEILLGRKELHGATGMVRAGILRDLGGWNEMLGVEDLPLWLALSRRFGPVAVLPDVCVHWRQHGSNSHRRFDRVYAATLLALDLHRDHPLHAKAVSLWRTRWWSAVAGERPLEALRRIPELGSWSCEFLRRLPKPFLALAGRKFP
jgi:glycosyltransferase involved in cell wall biosynthesis